MKKNLFFIVVLLCGLASSCSRDETERTISAIGVALNINELELTVGDTQTLTATVTPENATNRNVTWHSSNITIATVNTQGVVTAVAAGTATITVRTVDGGYTATAIVTVNTPTVSVTNVTLNTTSTVINVNNTETLTVTVAPTNATNQDVIWHSSDTSVATVDDNGVITAVSVGTTTIIVTTEDGNFTATCTVRVIPENSVWINGAAWATRNVDAPGTFAANPQSFGMFYQWNRRVGWSSTDPMVSSNGSNWEWTAATGTAWYPQNDPCPAGWRVPTQAELRSLVNAGNTWVANWNGTGVNGMLFGIAPNQIFLPAAGYRSINGILFFAIGIAGDYWSSTWDGTACTWGGIATPAQRLSFDSVPRIWIEGAGMNRAVGQSVRCVAE